VLFALGMVFGHSGRFDVLDEATVHSEGVWTVHLWLSMALEVWGVRL
jgi:hypothetical protein